MENRRGERDSPCWEEIKNAFKEKYYPKFVCDVKRNELLRLVQDSMKMVKYEKKYTELLKLLFPSLLVRWIVVKGRRGTTKGDTNTSYN